MHNETRPVSFMLSLTTEDENGSITLLAIKVMLIVSTTVQLRKLKSARCVVCFSALCFTLVSLGPPGVYFGVGNLLRIYDKKKRVFTSTCCTDSFDL